MNSNQRISRRTSPSLDPVFLVTIALALIVLAVAGWAWSSRGPHIQCPPPDHPVYASVIHQWICGASLNVGVKSR